MWGEEEQGHNLQHQISRSHSQAFAQTWGGGCYLHLWVKNCGFVFFNYFLWEHIICSNAMNQKIVTRRRKILLSAQKSDISLFTCKYSTSVQVYFFFWCLDLHRSKLQAIEECIYALLTTCMGVYSHGEEGWVKLGENERERRTAKAINRKWDTEQE